MSRVRDLYARFCERDKDRIIFTYPIFSLSYPIMFYLIISLSEVTETPSDAFIT